MQNQAEVLQEKKTKPVIYKKKPKAKKQRRKIQYLFTSYLILAISDFNGIYD